MKNLFKKIFAPLLIAFLAFSSVGYAAFNVYQGGTGRNTLTTDELLAGNGGSAVQLVTVGTGLDLTGGVLSISASSSPYSIQNTNSIFSTGLSGTGSGSVAVESFFSGTDAGNNATNADNSIFIGPTAGTDATDANNSIFIGSRTGSSASSANNSIFLGQLAGETATGAANSFFVGQNAGSGATNAAHSIFIGENAGVSDSVDNRFNNFGSILLGNYTSTGGFVNSVILGNGDAGVSIGTISNTKDNQFMLSDSIINARWRGIEYEFPSARAVNAYLVDRAGDGVLYWDPIPTAIWEVIHTDSLATTIVGAGASTGSSSEAIYAGVNAGAGATASTQSIFIGYGTGVNASNAAQGVYLGKNAGANATNASSSVFLATEAGNAATNADGAVFIGVGSGANATDAEGSIFIGGAAGQTAPNAAHSIFIGTATGSTDSVDNTADANQSSILIGNYIRTGGFSNSVLIGSGNISGFQANTAADQMMFADHLVNFRIAGVEYVMPSALGTGPAVLTDVAGDGVLSWEPSGGGSPVNIYNSDGTITGTRTVDGANNDILWDNMGAVDWNIDDHFTVNGGTAQLNVNANSDVNISAGTAVLQLNASDNSAEFFFPGGLTAGAGQGTSGQVYTSNGAGANPTWQSVGGGTVTSVSGTANRITSTGGATPVIDIAATYVGQTSITTLGTITTGVWNGTAIANANLANSTISGVALGGTLGALTATDTTLTFSGSYTGATARTVGLNLGNANSWTGQQTFGTSAPIFSTMTAGSILFAGTSGLLSQDNANFQWDGTNHTIGIGASASTTNKVTIADTVLAGSGSLAGSLMNMTQTWNTSGAPTALKLNVTNTASGAGLLMDLQVGGTSQFKVSKVGALTVLGAIATNAGISTGGLINVQSSAGIRSPALEGGNAAGSTLTFYSTSNGSPSGDYIAFNTGGAESMRIISSGRVGIGVTAPTAILHLKAGTTAASTAPLKFNSGSLLTTAEAGAMEFLTDKFYGTITTSAARKEFTLNDAALTSGTIPVATTNGRLTDSGLTSTSLTSSTYTATATNVTNITASTPNVASYQRIGAIVTVFGTITVTNTLAVASEVDISLPIASNLAAATDLNGTATMDSTASVNMYSKGDATNDRAQIFFTSAGVGQTSTIYYSFQYKVI